MRRTIISGSFLSIFILVFLSIMPTINANMGIEDKIKNNYDIELPNDFPLLYILFDSIWNFRVNLSWFFYDIANNTNSLLISAFFHVLTFIQIIRCFGFLYFWERVSLILGWIGDNTKL